MSAPSVLFASLRPYWGRVLVQPSGVDAEELPSGLVLPLTHAGDDGLRRGVVIHSAEDGILSPESDGLPPGTVVFFKGGTKLADVVVLDRADIYAYEVW